MAAVRGALIAVVILVCTLTLIVVQYLVMHLSPRHGGAIPVFYHRLVLRLLTIRLDVEGRLAPGPALIVANHSSWLDISIIGSLGELSFIAKREVASWPIFGLLARLQRSVFIDREQRGRTGKVRNEIVARLAAGERIVLFGEGTSSDGNRVLPFRTALFGVAEAGLPDGRPLPVQPLSLAYTRQHGLPIGRRFRPRFAWYGDMDMVSHLWGVLTAGPIDVKIVLHAPVTIDALGDRKQLAAHCETRVRAGVLTALLGRPISTDQAQRVAPLVAAAP